MDQLPPELLFLAFAVMWAGILTLASRLGGWNALAGTYRLSGSFEGDRRWFQSAQMRWRAGYGYCLIAGADRRGLYLALFFPFRVAHPPLFIPWADISVSKHTAFRTSCLELRFRRAPGIPLRISERLGRRLAGSAGGAWPGEIPVPI